MYLLNALNQDSSIKLLLGQCITYVIFGAGRELLLYIVLATVECNHHIHCTYTPKLIKAIFYGHCCESVRGKFPQRVLGAISSCTKLVGGWVII